MKKVNELLKSPEFTCNDVHLLRALLREELGEHRTVTYKLRKGRMVYRCRKLTSTFRRVNCEADISYRKDLCNITSFGRCNFPFQSVFYGSIVPAELPLELRKSIHILTTISETSNLCRDNLSGYERYAIGMWKAIEDMDLLVLPPSRSIFTDRTPSVQVILDQYGAIPDKSKDYDEFIELLSIEVSKKVLSDGNESYLKSATISDLLLDYHLGIMYPSVQTDSMGLNVVFRPEQVDKYFSFFRVFEVDLFKIGVHVYIRNLYVCMDASTFPFDYEQPPDREQTHWHEIVGSLLSRGVSMDEIQKHLPQGYI